MSAIKNQSRIYGIIKLIDVKIIVVEVASEENCCADKNGKENA